MRRTSVLSGAELFDESRRGEWEALVATSSTATPFQTPQWQETWSRFFLGAKKVRAIQVREGNDLIGLYPLVKTRGPWRTLRPMGVGPSDYLHPLVASGLEVSVGEEIWQTLLDQADADLIDLHQIREDKPLVARTSRSAAFHNRNHQQFVAQSDDAVDEGLQKVADLEVRAAREGFSQATCLVLDLPTSYDDFLGMLGKSLRYDVRKLDKTLFTGGRATIQRAGEGDVNLAMDILFDQHKRRWRKRWQPGAFTARAQKFHREWAALAVQKDWLRLGVLNLDGSPVGAIYGMTLGVTTYFYQAGFDPEFSSVSPGTLLVAHTIREAIEEGKQRFDFMRGDEGYKRRWKPQHALENLRFILPTDNGRGRLGAKWNLKASEIEQKIRKRLEGRGLV